MMPISRRRFEMIGLHFICAFAVIVQMRRISDFSFFLLRFIESDLPSIREVEISLVSRLSRPHFEMRELRVDCAFLVMVQLRRTSRFLVFSLVVL